MSHQLWCWGNNYESQLLIGAGANLTTPTYIMDVEQDARVFLGVNHTCLLEGTRLRCVGSNEFGQVGDGTRQRRTSWVELTNAATDVAVGFGHTCFTEDTVEFSIASRVRCTGSGYFGQLGNGVSFIDPDVPMRVDGLSS